MILARVRTPTSPAPTDTVHVVEWKPALTPGATIPATLCRLPVARTAAPVAEHDGTYRLCRMCQRAAQHRGVYVDEGGFT